MCVSARVRLLMCLCLRLCTLSTLVLLFVYITTNPHSKIAQLGCTKESMMPPSSSSSSSNARWKRSSIEHLLFCTERDTAENTLWVDVTGGKGSAQHRPAAPSIALRPRCSCLKTTGPLVGPAARAACLTLAGH